MLPADLKGLYEAYNEVYENVDLITDDLIEEVVEELIQECVEFGYELDEAADIVEGAAIEYLMELNPYAPAGSKEARAYQKSTTATKRGVERRAAVTAAKEKVKAKAKGAVAAAGIAGSIAKDELRRVGRAAAHTVTHNVQKKKAEVKSGVKSLLGKGLRKAAGAVGKVASKAAGAASRLGEELEQLDEISLKTKMKAYAASRNVDADYVYGDKVASQGDRIKANIVKKHGKEAGEHAERHADVSNFGRKDASGKYKGLPKSRIEKSDYRTTASGKMHKQDQAELKRELRIRRGKKLRSEEIELDIFDTILEFLQTEGYENPEQLMIELSSDHIDAILEAQEARNNPEKYEGEQDKKSAPVRGERRPMPPRGHKDREAFERWYAANVR